MDILTARKIKKELKALGVEGITPEVVRCVSTNLYTRANLTDCDRVVAAAKQSGGMGRDGRSFVSEKGGVYMTLQLNRNIEVKDAKQYVILAAMAVRAALKELGVESRVKWPNDILVKGKKICGILCEFAEVSERKSLIIGIGVNIKNDISEVKDVATTLAMQAVSVSRERLIAMIIKNLLEQEKEYYTKVLESYKAVSATLGKTVKFGGKSGKAVGIDEEGYLLVETQDGVERVTAGDVDVIE